MTASASGVALGTACPRGGAVQVTDWLPRRGTLERGAQFAARAGYRVRTSSRMTLRPLATRYANGRQPSLAGVRVVVACRHPWTILRWSGARSPRADAGLAVAAGGGHGEGDREDEGEQPHAEDDQHK